MVCMLWLVCIVIYFVLVACDPGFIDSSNFDDSENESEEVAVPSHQTE